MIKYLSPPGEDVPRLDHTDGVAFKRVASGYAHLHSYCFFPLYNVFSLCGRGKLKVGIT